jgi:sialate O-acetylesterase
MALAVPNTAMAVAVDVGDPDDIHPRDKATVGDRLARAALDRVYGRPVEGSGPTYRAMWREGPAVRLTFDHAGGGLVWRGERQGDTRRAFAVAGADRRFVWADARVDGATVVVSSPAVPDPVAVRYAWGDHPAAPLYNRAGLPAVPFRTDRWPVMPDDVEGERRSAVGARPGREAARRPPGGRR